MSFGNPLISTQRTSGKPVIFWEKQAMDPSKRKPTKTNKFVREQKQPVKGKAERAAPPAPSQRRGPNPRNNRPNAKGTEITAGVVTLTQAQLDAILSTVGSLVNQNEELKKSQTKQGIDGLATETDALHLGDGERDVENILNLQDASKQASKYTSHQHEDTHGVHARFVESEVPGLGSFMTNDMKVVAPDSIPGLGTVDQLAPTAAVSKAHLTQAEKKRLQWEKEKEACAALLNTGPPLLGVGSWKPSAQLRPLQVSKPATPKAHLTKAERRRRYPEDDWNMPLSLGQASSDTWHHKPTTKVALPSDGPMERDSHQSGGPPVHLSKIELKQKQWDQEKAENDARNAQQNRPPPSYQVRPHEPVNAHSTTQQQQHQAAPTSKAEQKRLQWEKERAENAVRETIANRPAYVTRAPVNNPPTSPSHPAPAPIGGIPRAHMSKAELKRIQWEQEKAEQHQEFNPWGRPGAGAPIRDASGQVLSDFNQRKEDGDVRHSQQEIIRQERQNRAITAMDNSSQPAAIRSSFIVGGAVPDTDRFMSAKEREKRAWLQELERQMEEKRLEKAKEKKKRLQEDTHDTWADRFAAPSGDSSAKAHQVPQSEVIRISSAPQVMSVAEPGLDNADPQPPLDLNSSTNQTGTVTHLRGRNRAMDEQTRREVEERWRRQQEHQDAVKAQVEDHKRKKAEERERRAREELEEEKRLQAERNALNAMYELERQKAKEKEEQQRLRMQSLKDAMDASTEQAQRERHERRMQKLQKGGHDVSNFNAKFEAKMTPRAPPTVQQVAPMTVPGLELTPRDVALMSTMNQSGYQQNKILVPTKFKALPSQPSSDLMSPRREFGVQTDDLTEKLQNLNIHNISRENSIDIEFKGPKNKTTKVRIKSAEQNSEGKQKKPQKLNQRPRWGGGGGGTPKKAVKQSEKDPYFDKRKQQREAAKLQRQKDMLEMAEKSIAQAKHKSNLRTRSKSRDRNQGNDQGDARSRSLAGSRRGSSPAVAVLRTRSSQQQSPPLPTHQSKRTASPEAVLQPSGQRSRIDTHRSHGQRQLPREAQENQPPLTNGYHQSTSPPVPTLCKPQDSKNDQPFNSYRSNSPPLPAVKHRLENEYNIDAHAFESTKPSNLKQNTQRHKYQDSDPLPPPNPDGDFVPFIRTANILNPQVAEEPLPLSREATAVEMARKAYVHGIQPANYGMKMINYEDRALLDATPEMPQAPENEWNRDPIMNPSLVTGHPTGRQDRILQQLSDLRRGLMQKQRELEVASPMMD